MRRGILWTIIFTLVGSMTAYAASFDSTNFSISGSLGDSIAGSQGSTNYRLVSSGGQSVNGQVESGSYKLGEGYTPKLENSLQLNAQQQGLLAHYAFDTGRGTVAYDESANANNGQIQSGGSWSGSGKVGGAYNVNSAGTTETGINLTSPAFTVGGWVYPTSNSSQVLLSNSRDCCGTYRGFELYVSYGNTTRFRVWSSDGTTSSVLAGNAVTLNQWNYIVASYDGSTMKLYNNGVLVGSQQYTSSSYTNPSSTVKIGRMGACNCSPVQNLVDEVKIFSRILGDSEIKAEYDAQNAGRPTGIDIGNVTPGVSNTAPLDMVVQTSSAGYSLMVNQNNNLTSGGNTIPAVSGSIASPTVWNEGVTKGLGFTLYGTNATAIPGKWNTGSSYAALPGSGTSFYTRTGQTGGNKDIVNMRLRLDTAASQPTGNYTNQMTLTGTMTP